MLPEPNLELPRNVEAEAALLGGLMCSNKLIDDVADVVRAEDFFEPLHGRLFEVMLREHNLGRPVTPVTLKSLLADDGALQQLGGQGYLAQLTGNLAALIGTLGCARQVAAMAQRRRIITNLHNAMTLAADMNTPAEDIVAAADAALSADSQLSSDIVQISAHDAFWQMVEEAKNDRPGVTAAGLKSFNEAMGPARRHHLCIVAGRPGMGKTALALSYSLGAALEGFGILFVSLEMSRFELMQRAASDLLFRSGSGVPYSAIRDNALHGDALKRFHACGGTLRDLPIQIVDAGSLTIGRLNSLVRRHRRRMEAKGKPFHLVVVDYLQLMRPDNRTSSVVEAVSEVSRGLKAIAKTHDVAVMALAQLNRSVESREDKRPRLADLRESGRSSRTPTRSCSSIAMPIILKMIRPRRRNSPSARTRSSSLAPSVATADRSPREASSMAHIRPCGGEGILPHGPQLDGRSSVPAGAVLPARGMGLAGREGVHQRAAGPWP